MLEKLINYTPFILSLVAIIVSILAWHKSRVIYEVVTTDNRAGEQKINDLLKTGKYTILHIQNDPSNSMRTIYVLGRIS